MARTQVKAALQAYMHSKAIGAGGPASGASSTRAIFDYWNLAGELSPAPPYGLVDSGGFDYLNLADEYPPVESKA